jgi:hypothetical protein
MMTPAAHHRQAHQFSISRTFVRLSSLLLLLSMILLRFGICLGVYVVSALIIGSGWISMGLPLSVSLLHGLL